MHASALLMASGADPRVEGDGMLGELAWAPYFGVFVVGGAQTVNGAGVGPENTDSQRFRGPDFGWLWATCAVMPPKSCSVAPAPGLPTPGCPRCPNHAK